MIFIAWCIACLITGSDILFTKRLITFVGVPSCLASNVTTLPVSINPHVEAFTNKESEFLRWDFQSATLSLSRIKASAVAVSGIRISASAKHINKIPSLVSKLYSSNSASIICTAFLSLRTRLISSDAFSVQNARSCELGSANGKSCASHVDSSTAYKGEINDHN